MLLRQALQQTRTGMPAPVLFNSHLLALDSVDGVSAMVQEDLFDFHFDTIRNRAATGRVRQVQPYRKAAAVIKGAQTS